MTGFLRNATRILFFTGKGGVGKTSLACAAAVSMARQGKKVLLVSTDPASNLDEVLGVRLSGEPTAVPGADGLFALNIDPEAAAKAYRERVVGPYRGVLPEASVNSMEEQLSGACTVEIAAFDEFTKLLGDAQRNGGIRSHHLRHGSDRTYASPVEASGRMDGIHRHEHDRHLVPGTAGRPRNAEVPLRRQPAVLSPIASTTTLVLVSRPERSALAEADRSRAELAEMGVANQILFLNGVFVAQDRSDAAACALEARGQEALAGDACRAGEASANRGPAAPLRSDGRGEPPECVRRHVAESQARCTRTSPKRSSPGFPFRP